MNFEVNSSEYTQRSVLKSKRQKNWLSTPGSTKRVTFQFEIPKITGKKQTVVTMVKSNKLDSNKCGIASLHT